MPRQSKEINPFDGGLNNYSDPRDIEDNELATATNINTSNAGRITIGDDFSVGVEETFGTPLRARGLFHYGSDYAANNSEADTDYELMTDGNNVARKVAGTDGASSWTADVVSMSNSPDNEYFVADGAVRISDKNDVDRDENATAHSNEVKYLGITKKKLWNTGSVTTALTDDEDAYIHRPYTSTVHFDHATPGSQAISAGHTFLDIQEKVGSEDIYINFQDSQSSFINKVHGTNGEPDSWTESNNNSSGIWGRYASLSSTYTNSATITPPSGGSNKFMVVNKTGQGDDYVRIKIRHSGTGNQKDYVDKSFFFQIFIPSQVKASMIDQALKVRIGNNVGDSGESGHDAYVYYVGVGELLSDDWTQLEFKYGEHDETEGSPSAASIDHVVVAAYFSSNSIDHGVSGGFTFAIADISIGESSRGMWNGFYKWYMSYIYDGTQESTTFELNGQSSPRQIENKILQVKLYARDNSGAFHIAGNTYSQRVTGANVYYSEFDLDGNAIDSDKRLFMIADFERGVRKPGDETYTVWKTSAESNSSHTQATPTQYFTTPLIDTFQTSAGYIEADKLRKVKFKTSTVMNRRSYVGDVRVFEYDAIFNDADSKRYGDRIYKSEPNMFDIYTELGYLDVAINDGDTTTDLEHYGDYLLQFKKRTLYIINVTQDIEYLEKAYQYRGVWSSSAVCRLPEGIAFVNDYGVFIFNGNELIDLLAKKIDRKHWELFMEDDPMIAYRPLTQDIIVINKGINGTIYLYNMVTESWTLQAGVTTGTGVVFNGTATNMITLNDGTVKMYTNNSNALHPHIWTTVAQVKTIDVVTKDQTLGDPAQRKTLKKVYITHKGTTTLPQVKYISNNDGVLRTLVNDVTDNDSLPASSAMTTTAFTPTNATNANNKYSYQVSIAGTAHPSVVINDISLVYRDKTLK